MTLDPFRGYQFHAYARTQLGDSVYAWVSWSASGGSITPTGMYTADTSAADAVVIATLNNSTISGTSSVTKHRVVRVVISPKNVVMSAGGSQQFRAYGRTDTGDSMGVSVIFTATGGLMLGNGMYTAGPTAGNYRVIAREFTGSLADTSILTLQLPPVASVIVNPSAAIVTAGQTAQLTAIPQDAAGNPLTGRVVTWGTNKPAVATVDGNGLVTAVAAGAATITATSEGQSGAAGLTVSVVPIASVTVSPATANVVVGQTTQLTATPKDASGAALPSRVVTWASTNSAVATVNGSGLVTAVAAGTATMTATSEGQSGTAAITVAVAPVATVAVNPATASIGVAQMVQLTATQKDASGTLLSGRVVTWSSSAPAAATVSGTGLVTAVAAGSATITATSEGKSGTAGITVSAAVTDPGVVANLTVASVTPTSVTLSFVEVTDGAGQAASYDIRWAQGTLVWGSAPDVSQGTCAAPMTGTAIGATRTCAVTGLASGTSYQFQLVAFRGRLNLDAVFGGLSNVASGTTTSSTAPVATVTVSPSSGGAGVGQVMQLAAILKDAGGSTLSGRVVTWTSSAPSLISVSGSGLVTAIAAGVATITATSEGKSGTATVTGVVSLPGGEPVFNVVNGDAVIYQDNMDLYTTPHEMDVWPGYSLHPFYPDLYPNNYAVITSAHGVGGKALRLVYDKGNGDRFIWKTNPENMSTWYAPGNAAFVVQYWFRISKNGAPGGGPGYGSTAVGMKWVEFWNVGGGARTQFSVTLGNATTGPLWHVNPSSRGQVGFQPVGPYWNQLNNNQWHRVTYLYQPNSSGGATDGVARMWVDGTKIVDVSRAAAGVTPPGGTKVWCTLAEVGQLDTPQIGTINLGEYMNGGLGDGVTDLPMALDFDDFVWWKLPARIP
jgi:uncharacterized protein YjdB